MMVRAQLPKWRVYHTGKIPWLCWVGFAKSGEDAITAYLEQLRRGGLAAEPSEFFAVKAA